MPVCPGALASLRSPILRSSAFSVEQTFWSESGKSQGFGDGVPESNNDPFLIVADEVTPGKSPTASGSRGFGAGARGCRTGNSGRCWCALPSPTLVLQVHLLVFERTPQTFDENVVHCGVRVRPC